MNYTIENLRERIDKLNKYRNTYYNHNTSMVSDFEYDKLFDELKEMEAALDIYYPDSPTQSVGYKVVSSLEKVTHEYPLLSLDKTKSTSDIFKFANKCDLVLSAKMDGLTVCITYDNGNLVKAETRGDGIEGELITHNINTFNNVPKTIPYKEHLVVVGEAILTEDKLDVINANLPDDKKYKHVRNLVSGTVRQLDSNICAQRHPLFIAWDCRTDISTTLYSKLVKLYNWGFTVVPCVCIDTSHRDKLELECDIDYLRNNCRISNYPIDGIVCTINDIEYGKSLGQTSHHFKNAIAYKFYDEEVVTHLRDIEWSMGRTGVLTPVAIFDTVDIDGTSVSRASLHNISILKELKLGLADEITVYKANAIIPQIGENLTKSDDYVIPIECPYCHGIVKKVTDNESTVLMCINKDCWARKLNEFTHFVSKSCMNIVGLSEQSIRLFLEKGWISEPIDFYNDKLYSYYLDLINTDGWSNISADKLFKAIDDSKNVKLENAINALGIEGVGVKASKDIAKYCKYDWHNFVNPEYYEHFDRIEGFGEITSSSICVYIDIHKDDISNLFSKFNFTDSTDDNNSSILSDKTFVITGSLNHYKNRDELVSVIESNGGKVSSSVSAKTDYLINNDINSNSGKNKKAKELGLPIITEEDFMKLFMKSCIDNTIDEFVGNPNKTIFTNFDTLFDTRDFTADEEKVYKTIQTKNAKKTGRKLF